MDLTTHALRCDPQVQQLVPEDRLHVRTVDGLEELRVQLPSVGSRLVAILFAGRVFRSAQKVSSSWWLV